MPKRLMRILGVTLLVIAAVAVLLYNFGSMWTPSADVRQAYAASAAAGQAPPVDGAFHIPVPGCVCHSPDAAVQMHHSARRIKDCRTPGCHG